MTAAISIPYQELIKTHKRVCRAQARAAEARRDLDDVLADLYDQGVPQSFMARLMGTTQPYVSQRISAHRRELAYGTASDRRHNEDAASHQRREGGDV
ncbi:MAG: hypothetical protein KDB26_09430 [Microthrixaceae bacterium]|nr:hypothetical protein [Microthrixaceae bacterium]